MRRSCSDSLLTVCQVDRVFGSDSLMEDGETAYLEAGADMTAIDRFDNVTPGSERGSTRERGRPRAKRRAAALSANTGRDQSACASLSQDRSGSEPSAHNHSFRLADRAFTGHGTRHRLRNRRGGFIWRSWSFGSPDDSCHAPAIRGRRLQTAVRETRP